jgi:hypothetical protein
VGEFGFHTWVVEVNRNRAKKLAPTAARVHNLRGEAVYDDTIVPFT